MLFTIERIRNLVLASAALLVIAIAVFLGFAKWRHPFSRRDIPQRLGIDIQQEANGVTYTQAHGGHTIFKIHAARVVQLRDNRATLYDVVIELYGKDGARVDRIQGAEFEYDRGTSIATAAGPVEIDMQRPAAAPPPGATPAKPGPNDGIRVRTSGITFNQNTGIVTTTRHLDFTTKQGSGSALGASYDSDLGYLVLSQDVELTTTRGANPVSLHAAHAEFNRDAQICTLSQAVAQSRGQRATAVEARVSLRQDGSVDHLDASNGLTITTPAGSRLAAPTGGLQFTEKNQPRHAHLEGGVTIDSAAATRSVHGSAPVMDLDFTAGDLSRAHLERGVELQSQDQGQSMQNGSAVPVQMVRNWRSPVADIGFRSTGPNQVELASLHGTGGVAVTSETRRAGAAPIPSRLASDDLTAQFGQRGTLTSMTGIGHAALEETTATGAHETATGDHVEAQFTPAPPATSAPGKVPLSSSAAAQQPLSMGSAELQTAQLDGHVVLVERPAPKPGSKPESQSPLRATAGRAVYDASSATASSGQWLHLTVNPRVGDGGIDLSADKIDIAQSSGDAFAHGNVKATWISESPSTENSPSSATDAPQQSFALGGTAPAHVFAAEAQLHQGTGEATFRGHARLWQDQNSISAPLIVLNRQQQTLGAQASGPVEPVLAVLLNAQATPVAPQATAAHAPSVIRVRSGNLQYSAQDRKAVLRAAPLPSVTVENGAADTAADQLEVYLVPATAPRQAASAASAATPSQVDRIVALGHVVITSQGRRGTGAQLVYTAQTGDYVLTGTSTAPPRMTDAQRGSVTGQSLIFNSRDDSVSIEGGAQATSTQTTAPR